MSLAGAGSVEVVAGGAGAGEALGIPGATEAIASRCLVASLLPVVRLGSSMILMPRERRHGGGVTADIGASGVAAVGSYADAEFSGVWGAV